MFRKIHSNRDPKDTLYSEIKKEFSPYFGKISGLGRSILARHPRFFFWSMVVLMLVSTGISFTICRHQEKRPPRHILQNPVEHGFDQIISLGAKLKETMHLKRRIDSIAAKKNISKADSAFLDSALDKLQQLQQTNKR